MTSSVSSSPLAAKHPLCPHKGGCLMYSLKVILNYYLKKKSFFIYLFFKGYWAAVRLWNGNSRVLFSRPYTAADFAEAFKPAQSSAPEETFEIRSFPCHNSRSF